MDLSPVMPTLFSKSFNSMTEPNWLKSETHGHQKVILDLGVIAATNGLLPLSKKPDILIRMTVNSSCHSSFTLKNTGVCLSQPTSLTKDTHKRMLCKQ